MAESGGLKEKIFFLIRRLVQFFQVVRLVGKLPHGIDVGDKNARLSLALCADHPQNFGAGVLVQASHRLVENVDHRLLQNPAQEHGHFHPQRQEAAVHPDGRAQRPRASSRAFENTLSRP